MLYLPFVKNKFGLNDAQIGMALFCLALGTLITIPVIPWINKKLGVGRSTKYGILIFALLYNLPLWAPSYLLLCLSLLFVGMFSGFTDVSMNALVSTIEKEDKENFMSAAHGFFSLGGFIGASIGSILMINLNTPTHHMALMALIIVITNLVLAHKYIGIKEVETEQSEETNSSFWKNLRPLLGLSLVAFIIMWNEGATEHWSNLFLHDIIGVTESKAGLGFILFSLFMTIGRFLGDGISSRIGSKKIIVNGIGVAITGHLLILTSSLITSVAGFGLLGLGLSVIIPELFRIAGNTKGVSASMGISIVSGIGFVGFLIGPVVLGFISNAFGLLISFVALLVTVVISLMLIFSMKTSK